MRIKNLHYQPKVSSGLLATLLFTFLVALVTNYGLLNMDDDRDMVVADYDHLLLSGQRIQELVEGKATATENYLLSKNKLDLAGTDQAHQQILKLLEQLSGELAGAKEKQLLTQVQEAEQQVQLSLDHLSSGLSVLPTDGQIMQQQHHLNQLIRSLVQLQAMQYQQLVWKFAQSFSHRHKIVLVFTLSGLLLSAALAFLLSKIYSLLFLRDQESKGRLNLALKLAPMSYWDLDLASKLMARSANHDQLFGHSENLIKWSLESTLEQVHPADREQFRTKMAAAIKAGKDFQLEHRVVWPDQSIHWLSVLGKVHCQDQLPVRVIGACMDITQKVQATDSLQQLLELSRLDLEKLKMERELREHFVATLAHDLRNPLFTAKLSAQILPKYADRPESQKRATSMILSSIERADNMIRDLLDTNQIRAGNRLPINIIPFELSSVVDGWLKEFVPAHGDRFFIAGDQNIRGHWCRDSLKRMLENLISNAVKYGFTNTPVTVTIVQALDKVRISVHNEGEGISAQEQANIFEAYHRTPSARLSGQKGWGLGLTLVRGITASHGGEIWIQSRPGLGATFNIELPLDARPYQELGETGHEFRLQRSS